MSSPPQRKDAKTQRLDRDSLDKLSRIIITKAIQVHSKLGPGLLESVYRICLIHELRKAGVHVLAEQLVPVIYDGELQIDHGYRLDLLVEDEIIVEIKAVEKILPVHLAQLNAPRLVQGLRRVVNNF